MTHAEKIKWMKQWCERNGARLELVGECGFGRECVGVVCLGVYPDYTWRDNDSTSENYYERIDPNGDVFTPADAYHKHDCVAVLGRGEYAEAQLYDWLKWFEENGFELKSGDVPEEELIKGIPDFLVVRRWVRMVRGLVPKKEEIPVAVLPGARPVLKHTKKTVVQVTSDDIDKFVNAVFAYELKLTNYECVAWEEYSNDTAYKKNVSAKPGFDEYATKYSIERKQWPSLQALLDVACGRGLIEPGEYLISVSW